MAVYGNGTSKNKWMMFGIFVTGTLILAHRFSARMSSENQVLGSVDEIEEKFILIQPRIQKQVDGTGTDSAENGVELEQVHQEFNSSKTIQELHKLCPTEKKNIDSLVKAQRNHTVYSNVLLIIVALFEDYQEVFKIHNILYRKTFPKMLFCGPSKKASLGAEYPFVFFREVTRDKELFYTCVNEAMKKYKDTNLDGYLLLSDDLLFFHWNVDFSKENLDKIWMKQTKLNRYDLNTNCHTEGGRTDLTNCAPSSWTPLMPHRQDGKRAKTALIEMKISNNSVLTKCFHTLTEKNGGPFRVNYAWFMGDMFYIPASITSEYLLISDVFAKNNLIHALAVPTIAKCFEDTHGIYSLPGINDPKTRPLLKKKPTEVINGAIKDKKPFVHPVKFSGIITGKNLQDRNYFCNTLIPEFFRR